MDPDRGADHHPGLRHLAPEYDNSIKINDAGEEEYPVGTVDSHQQHLHRRNFCLGAAPTQTACRNNGGTWSRRANPRAGYGPTQEFTRDARALTHEGKWGFGNTSSRWPKWPPTTTAAPCRSPVAEREHLLQMIDGTGPYAGMSLADRRARAASTFLPRPKRVLESAQYTSMPRSTCRSRLPVSTSPCSAPRSSAAS